MAYTAKRHVTPNELSEFLNRTQAERHQIIFNFARSEIFLSRMPNALAADRKAIRNSTTDVTRVWISASEYISLGQCQNTL